MAEFFQSSLFFGAFISLFTYALGMLINKKIKSPVFNPLLVSIVLTIVVLIVLKVDYNAYNESAKYIGYLLTPTTVCLAIPLYEQFESLKKNVTAILVGIFTGVVTSLVSTFALAYIFGLTHESYVTLLPKSITSAIGMGLSEELGGYVSLTVAVICITGIFGNIIAEGICKLFRIKHPVAKGVGIGTSSHAFGTTKALELGEVEGAMSSLSIVVAGIMTVILAGVFANFM